MTIYQKMLVFYGVMAFLCTLITFFLAKERPVIRGLSALLVGATWPMSFPVALLFCLF
ncbi:GhoT/OrtT family toxin [Mangrovibacter yixingensis]|uniref:GhoT/OrtT family toxin n=1 Tax=Mangrovibacter yixingensis TaxID=1529639 RepID=UPI001CFBAAEB|nr:GhoT/OrtT family toxin [Mangrovibacter yixingensis]